MFSCTLFQCPFDLATKFSWGSKQEPRELRPDTGNGRMLEKQLWRGDTKRGLRAEAMYEHRQ